MGASSSALSTKACVELGRSEAASLPCPADVTALRARVAHHRLLPFEARFESRVDYIEESHLDARLPLPLPFRTLRTFRAHMKLPPHTRVVVRFPVPQKDGRVVSPGLNSLWLAGPPHAHTLAVVCTASGEGAITGDQYVLTPGERTRVPANYRFSAISRAGDEYEVFISRDARRFDVHVWREGKEVDFHARTIFDPSPHAPVRINMYTEHLRKALLMHDLLRARYPDEPAHVVAARLDDPSLTDEVVARPTCSLWTCFVAGSMRVLGCLFSRRLWRVKPPGTAKLWARPHQ
jgi:hypothetical protein